MDNLEITVTKDDHIKDILDIYSYYIINSPATFEIDIPEYDEFKSRVYNI